MLLSPVKRAQYRKQGILEYLINLSNGEIIDSCVYARIDTFSYRNENFRKKQIPYRWSLIDNAMKTVKFPNGGKLGYGSTIFWYVNNLTWNKETKTFSCPGLKYFSDISDHKIVLKNSKTGVTRTFEYSDYLKASDDSGASIIWKCVEDTSLKFELSYKYKK